MGSSRTGSTPQLTATTHVNHTRGAPHKPCRPYKRTSVRGAGQFPQQFSKRAAYVDEEAEPGDDDENKCYTKPMENGPTQASHAESRRRLRQTELASDRCNATNQKSARGASCCCLRFGAFCLFVVVRRYRPEFNLSSASGGPARLSSAAYVSLRA